MLCRGGAEALALHFDETLVTLDISQDMVHAFHLSALPEAPPQVAILFLDRLTAWTMALPGAGIARKK